MPRAIDLDRRSTSTVSSARSRVTLKGDTFGEKQLEAELAGTDLKGNRIASATRGRSNSRSSGASKKSKGRLPSKGSKRKSPSPRQRLAPRLLRADQRVPLLSTAPKAVAVEVPRRAPPSSIDGRR